MQHRAPEAKVVYVKIAVGLVAAMMCNTDHEPKRAHSTARENTRVCAEEGEGGTRKMHRAFIQYVCLLVVDISVHNYSGRYCWEIRGQAAVLGAERRKVICEHIAWLYQQEEGGIKIGTREVAW